MLEHNISAWYRLKCLKARLARKLTLTIQKTTFDIYQIYSGGAGKQYSYEEKSVLINILLFRITISRAKNRVAVCCKNREQIIYSMPCFGSSRLPMSEMIRVFFIQRHVHVRLCSMVIICSYYRAPWRWWKYNIVRRNVKNWRIVLYLTDDKIEWKVF